MAKCLLQVKFYYIVYRRPHHSESLESSILVAWLLLMDHSTLWAIRTMESLHLLTQTSHVVSTEAVTLINNSTEGPKAKKTKVTKKVTVITTGSQLPEPCPLPIFSERTKEIISSGIKGNDRFFLLREAVIFYEGICLHPSHTEYTTMAKTLCHKYPELKDKGDKYWVSVHACNYVTM